MCRAEVPCTGWDSGEGSGWLHAPKARLEEEQADFELTDELKGLQEDMARLYVKQLAKGSIIDVDEQSRKFLVLTREEGGSGGGSSPDQEDRSQQASQNFSSQAAAASTTSTPLLAVTTPSAARGGATTTTTTKEEAEEEEEEKGPRKRGFRGGRGHYSHRQNHYNQRQRRSHHTYIKEGKAEEAAKVTGQEEPAMGAPRKGKRGRGGGGGGKGGRGRGGCRAQIGNGQPEDCS